MIAIVDYGMGNLGSIRNMLRKIGAAAQITADPAAIRAADKLILPGVGAFDIAMRNLDTLGLLPVLNEQVLDKGCPVLGICLGVQLLSRDSEEGQLPGLGWIDAHTRRFRFEEANGSAPGALKVPHMGWNFIQGTRPHPLLDDLPAEPRFYFVHSYHVLCEQPDDVLMRTHYGIDFTAGVARGNILGTQFHPEKSHKFGMALLRNYAAL